jgi:uncharacterized membrane protein YfcA
LTGPALAAAIAITCGAAACQSLTGFGFALVMVPLLSLVWDVKSAVVTSTLLSTVSLLPLLFEVRGHVQMSRVAPLLVGSFAGIPAGIWMLDWIDPEALKILVGATVIAASALLYLAPRSARSQVRAVPSTMVGVLSGVLRGSTSMGGPPVVLYLLGSERQIEAFRSTLLAFFVPTGLLTVAGLAVAGRVTPDILRTAAITLPALAAGLILGARLRAAIREEVFQTLVLLVLIATSIAVIVSAATGLV